MKADATQMSLLNDSVPQKEKSCLEVTTHREVYFRSGKIVAVNVNLFRGTKKSVKEASIKNLEKKGTSLGIKSGTCSKIEKMITTWMKALYYMYEEQRNYVVKVRRLPVFITLTLPSKQRHTDVEIKRQILMPFLQNLKKSDSCKYYFWKAEVQQNGNIHFHLIIDQYIKKEYLTSLWNYHCESLSYVTEFEKAHGNKQPPSTHVEKIDSMRKATSYVLKYVNKDVEGRNIEGRKWDCSKELKNLRLQSYLEDQSLTKYLEWLVAENKVVEYHDDFFSVYNFTPFFDWNNDYRFIQEIEQPDSLQIYKLLYMASEKIQTSKKNVQKVKSQVPTQLNLFSEDMHKPIDWTLRD